MNSSSLWQLSLYFSAMITFLVKGVYCTKAGTEVHMVEILCTWCCFPACTWSLVSCWSGSVNRSAHVHPLWVSVHNVCVCVFVCVCVWECGVSVCMQACMCLCACMYACIYVGWCAMCMQAGVSKLFEKYLLEMHKIIILLWPTSTWPLCNVTLFFWYICMLELIMTV